MACGLLVAESVGKWIVVALMLCGCGRSTGHIDPLCAGLDENSCRARAECVADYCQACTCTATFVGCRGTLDARLPCPAVGCAQPLCCRSNADCASNSFLFCLAPGEFAGCGACQRPPVCTSDGECQVDGGTQICDVGQCFCSQEPSCIAGCTADSDCGVAQSCRADHRCVPKLCQVDPDCPTYYKCGAGGSCVRRPCTQDADCSNGACVNGHCYPGLGMCTAPPA